MQIASVVMNKRCDQRRVCAILISDDFIVDDAKLQSNWVATNCQIEEQDLNDWNDGQKCNSAKNENIQQ